MGIEHRASGARCRFLGVAVLLVTACGGRSVRSSSDPEAPAVGGSRPDGAGSGGSADDPCALTRCEHGGTCTVSESRPRCTCPGAYTGSACELPRFEGLGFVPGTVISVASAISADGRVVVGQARSADVSGPLLAYRWTIGGALLDLSPIENPNDVSSAGSVVVGMANSRPYRWDTETGVSLLPEPQGMTGTAQGVASAVSGDGKIIAGHWFGGVGAGFRWKADSGYESVPDCPEFIASDMSDDGSVVVGSCPSPLASPAVWELARVEGIGLLAGDEIGSARAVSGDGRVVVGSSSLRATPVPHAFRWTRAEGLRALGAAPGGVEWNAFDTNGDGSVIVGAAFSGGPPLIWREDEGLRLLPEVMAERGADFSGWTLERASGVSADGRVIVGDGHNPNGRAEAFIVRLD